MDAYLYEVDKGHFIDEISDGQGMSWFLLARTIVLSVTWVSVIHFLIISIALV